MNAQGRKDDRIDRIQQEKQALRQLTNEMSIQWQRALGGMVAVPSAIALGFATTAMYVGLFIELGFQVFREDVRELRETTEAQWRFQEQQRPRAGDEAQREQPRA